MHSTTVFLAALVSCLAIPSALGTPIGAAAPMERRNLLPQQEQASPELSPGLASPVDKRAPEPQNDGPSDAAAPGFPNGEPKCDPSGCTHDNVQAMMKYHSAWQGTPAGKAKQQYVNGLNRGAAAGGLAGKPGK